MNQECREMQRSRAIEEFLTHLKTERRLSPHTVLNYGRDLKMLEEFCVRRGMTEWNHVDPGAARLFPADMYKRQLSGNTIRRALSAARSFYRYLIRENQCALNPFDGVKAPKAPKRLPQTLTIEQANQLVELPGTDPVSVRDRAMLELFYSSGIRLQELAGLNLLDVDLDERIMKVVGKGSKDRLVPIGRRAASALREWIDCRKGTVQSDETALFVTRNGNRVSVRNVQKRVEVRGSEQGVPVHVHPHMLRHSFATHVLTSSGEIRAVQELLGHADVSTTQIYTHLDFGHLSREYDRSHPRARKKQREIAETKNTRN